jgi:prepilin-type processing-associated H-X9-DG protein
MVWIVTGLFLLLVGTLLAGALPAGRSVAAEEKDAALPADLAAVPSDGIVFLSIRLGDLWNHEALKEVRATFLKEVPQALPEMTKFLGSPPGDIERLSIALWGIGPTRPEPVLMAVRTAQPYDRKKVMSAAALEEAAQKVSDREIYAPKTDRERPAFVFLDKQSYLLGPVETLKAYFEKGAPKTDGNLAGVIRLAAGKHTYVAGANIEAINQAVGDMLPPELAPFKPILQAKLATAMLDFGNETKLSAEVKFAKEADAQEGAKAIKMALGLADQALTPLIGLLSKETGSKRVAELAKDAQAAIRAAKLDQKDTTVQLSANLKTDLASMTAGLVEGIQKVREAAARAQSANNLKQLAIAMHNYHSVHGAFPPAAIYDKDGKALLSWRVLLLPYIEGDQLYKEFHLDEPWDSEHNKKLLEKMPKTYASPAAANLNEHKSSYLGFAGKGALFDGSKGKKIQEIIDGTSNTIMFIETKGGVEWSKPGDIPFDADKPLPKVGGLFPNGTNAAFCDGSVRFLSDKIKEMTLKALITIAGGEVIDQNDL